MWFTEFRVDKVARVTPTGTVTEFDVHTPPFAVDGPTGIAAGPDGNLWFTELNANRIGRITPAGTVTHFPTGGNSSPSGIAAGPDGNLWFTEPFNGARIGRITPTGTITEFATGLSGLSDSPSGITSGPDGNLWFTEASAGGGGIGRITPTGTITEFRTGLTVNSGPTGITAGPDGNLWFTESSSDQVARIAPTGTITEFKAGITRASNPQGITVGPDGSFWFAEAFGRIGVMPLPVNGPPSCTSQSVGVGNASAKAISLGCVDAESDPLTFAVVAGPAHGALGGLNATTGAVTYTPGGSYSGPDSFTFKATDAQGDSNIATLSITVAPAPVPQAGGLTVSAGQIAALLRHEILPSGKAAKIAAILKKGLFALSFRALTAGTAVVGWYQLPLGAKLAKKKKATPVLVATATASFSGAGAATVNVKLTPTGRRLLKHANQLKLTAKGTFTPVGNRAISVTKSFVLKR